MACTYSTKKRKPGPQKGFRTKRRPHPQSENDLETGLNAMTLQRLQIPKIIESGNEVTLNVGYSDDRHSYSSVLHDESQTRWHDYRMVELPTDNIEPVTQSWDFTISGEIESELYVEATITA